jgi:hypothetical protein
MSSAGVVVMTYTRGFSLRLNFASAASQATRARRSVLSKYGRHVIHPRLDDGALDLHRAGGSIFQRAPLRPRGGPVASRSAVAPIPVSSPPRVLNSACTASISKPASAHRRCVAEPRGGPIRIDGCQYRSLHLAAPVRSPS